MKEFIGCREFGRYPSRDIESELSNIPWSSGKLE
jgi:hypothetical protein